ncbi:hypothetical protein [Plantactinospora sp. KLBMP9567]|uniref:hypothetical protein n=1 Tax=Plantactinospora sp. KLBMP9567 TaxID=3085900 RepID=UPI0029819E07|nr:hypothetical protein [Plantactinospora sp. KLBMP9567]MDW5322874.1 hypothetical protein [Plantactinospora sp. KLBMP9567]
MNAAWTVLAAQTTLSGSSVASIAPSAKQVNGLLPASPTKSKGLLGVPGAPPVSSITLLANRVWDEGNWMGKAGRNSTKTRGIRALTRAQRSTVLSRATRLVAQLNAARARCIESVALLDRVADLVHIKAEPVPVAVAAQGPAGSCMLGEAVNGVIPLAAGGRVRRAPTLNAGPWDGAGHLVLFATQERVLFDPTLDQVSVATGFPVGTLIMPVTPDELYADDVSFGIDEGCQVLYRVVRGDSTWRTAYNSQYAVLGQTARATAQRALELEGFDENLV